MLGEGRLNLWISIASGASRSSGISWPWHDAPDAVRATRAKYRTEGK